MATTASRSPSAATTSGWTAWTFPASGIIGLLLGNLMAVLSWTLVCAPIAARTRLTLYWYLRRIAGPGQPPG